MDNIKDLRSQKDSLIDELHNTIDHEMMKPDNEINLDTVKQCVDLLYSLENCTLPDSEESREQLLKIEQSKKRKPNNKLMNNKLFKIAVAACFTIFIIGSTNILSAKAFGFNFISTVIEMGADFLKIDINHTDSTMLDSEELNNELNLRLATEDFDPMLPTYFPEKMNITQFRIDNTYQINNYAVSLKSKSITINILIQNYINTSAPFQIPEAENVEELTVNNITVYTINLDDIYTACYQCDNAVYQITMDCSYDEFIQIIESLQ